MNKRAFLLAITILLLGGVTGLGYYLTGDVKLPAQEESHTKVFNAERLVFSYENDAIRLVKRIPLQAVLPPSDELPDDPTISGFWFELRDRAGQVLYRRLIPNPLLEVYEGPSDEDPSRIERHESLATRTTFSLLVPFRAEAVEVVLMGSSLRPRAKREPARDLLHLPLDLKASVLVRREP